MSHSSADEPRARALVTALEAQHQVRLALDCRDLIAGAGWSDQLYRWVTQCHGGVLLLTQSVLDKWDWVLQEATLLRARAAVEADAFRLFVIVDEPVLADPRYAQIFGALSLAALQQQKVPAGADWVAQLAGIVDTIHRGLAEIAPFHMDYQGRLAEQVFDELAPVADRDAGYHLLDQVYGGDVAPWRSLTTPRRALRVLCARRLAQGDFGAFGDIEEMFQQLRFVSRRAEREALYFWLQSWWVPLDNAERLQQAFDRMRETAAPSEAALPAPPRNIVLLQADWQPQRVAELHRHRRFAPYRKTGTGVSVAAGDEVAEVFTARVADALRNRLFKDDLAIPAAAIAADLALDFADGKTVFVFAEVGATAAHVLDAARLFGSCLFVLAVAGEHRADIERELGLAAVLPPAGALPYKLNLRRSQRAFDHAQDEAVAVAAARN